MIAETTEFIERFKGTYSKTLQVQSRVKMLEKLELVEVDEVDTSALRLKFPPSPRSGQYPVVVNELGKSYGDHVVFRDASLVIERGQKVAFVGKNQVAWKVRPDNKVVVKGEWETPKQRLDAAEKVLAELARLAA